MKYLTIQDLRKFLHIGFDKAYAFVQVPFFHLFASGRMGNG